LASNIRVTPEQLHSIAGQLNAGAGEVDGILRQLAGQVAPLGSDWAGVAQARFLTLWEQWQRDSAGVHQALMGIAQLMQQAGTQYESTEQGIAGSFGRGA
jgi:early secretory antigenic target protein ESAT-6